MKLTSEFTTKFDNLRAEFEAKKKVLALEGRKLIHEQLKKIFDADPDLAAIYWRQYTPYFNDGDTCEFGLHGMSVSWYKDNVTAEERAGLELHELDNEETFIVAEDLWGDFKLITESPYGFPEKCRQSYVAAEGIEDFLENNLEIAKDLFGDHVKVFAIRSGIEVEEYEHD